MMERLKGFSILISKAALTIVATIFMFNLANVSEAATTPFSTGSGTILIVVSGDVPGLTHEQLADYLAKKMQEEAKNNWHFAAGKQGVESTKQGFLVFQDPAPNLER